MGRVAERDDGAALPLSVLREMRDAAGGDEIKSISA